MRRLTVRAAILGVVGATVAVGVAPTPAQAAWPQPCRAEGVSMYGRYPINHDQQIFFCIPEPFTPRWVHSETCPAGTHPEATLTPYYPDSTTVFLATATCVSD
ncbi:hypothetical protein [Micromonospora sp. HM5-17]|jgi:hypothetical protein|uniref:hypothetical protein n=1 Tax=Micromonospora sp. HM5-17 TaxID=2487710 RepID=UPI000F46AEEE|nr:hypothetical protein [Micromonospora sp. HM5-17]ROT29397.1 hypothetical protein EF879_20735 [Micromonospora sp. HM5-17]